MHTALLALLSLLDKAASQHFRLCIVEMHSRKLRHDDMSAKNVTQYFGYALASQRVKIESALFFVHQYIPEIDPPPHT